MGRAADLDVVADALAGSLAGLLSATRTPGVAVALASTDELEVVASGYADLVTGRPMTGSTVAPAGSLSKPLLGLAAMRLREAGVLDLDAPIDDHLAPGTRTRCPHDPRAVTALTLASHQGGYQGDTYDAALRPPAPVAGYVAERHRVGRTPEYGGARSLFTRVGTYAYSSFGLAVLASAVENVAGEAYPALVDREVLLPAGMTRSALPTGGAGRSRRDDLLAGDDSATGYMNFGGWCVPTPILHSATYPANGLVTCVTDYARLLQCLLRAAAADSSVVTRAGLAEMVRPRIARASPVTPDTYAGFTLELADPRLGPPWWWGHSAAYPWGYWWDARVYPRLDLVVVALSNRWDMMRFHNPADRTAAGIATRWAAQWAATGVPTAARRPPPRGSGTDVDADCSAWIGALVAERVNGALGVTDRLRDDDVARMARDARPLVGVDPSGWDADAFTHGLRAMEDIAPDPAAIARNAADQGPGSGLWALACGSVAPELPMPIRAFAVER